MKIYLQNGKKMYFSIPYLDRFIDEERKKPASKIEIGDKFFENIEDFWKLWNKNLQKDEIKYKEKYDAMMAELEANQAIYESIFYALKMNLKQGKPLIFDSIDVTDVWYDLGVLHFMTFLVQHDCTYYVVTPEDPDGYPGRDKMEIILFSAFVDEN